MSKFVVALVSVMIVAILVLTLVYDPSQDMEAKRYTVAKVFAKFETISKKLRGAF